VALSINPITYIISIPKADLTLIQLSPVEIRELNLNTFRLDLKSWEDSEEGIVQPKTHTHNTEVSLAGITFARVIEILDPYSITFEDGQYAVNLIGANSNVGDKVNVNQVSVRSANSAGLISSPDIEYSSFNGAVSLDVDSVYAGTTFPIGTERQPVNNIEDALLIAEYRGFKKLRMLSDFTFTTGANIDDFEILGESRDTTSIVLSAGANCSNLRVRDCGVTGILDGRTKLTNCEVGNLLYIDGDITNCGLFGSLSLSGSGKVVIADCYTVDQDNPPTINMGGSGNDLAMPNYSGIVTIKNLSGADNEIGLGMDAGMCILDSTITAGTIIVSGIGVLFDYSDGATVNTDGILNTQQISASVWDENIGNHLVPNTTGHEMYHQVYNDTVTIDTVNGTSGTTFPTGSEENPVDNLADALTICNEHNFKTIHIHGAAIINGEDVTGITFSADRSLGNSVTINSMFNTGACYFTDLTVSGTLSGSVRFTTCVLGRLTSFDGGAKNCLLTGDIDLTGTNANYFTECDTYMVDDTYKTISVGTSNLNLIKCRGAWEIADLTGIQQIACDLNGHFHIADTCVSGLVAAAGNMRLRDDSGAGCTVIDGSLNVSKIGEGVWADPNGLSVMSDLSFIKGIEGGRWIISGGQMIFYTDDNITELARFDLTYDANQNPVERTRI